MNPDKYTDDNELIELRLQLHHEKCRADNLWEVVKFERAERKRLEAQVDELNTMLKAEREVTDAWTKDASRSRDQYNGIIDTQLSAIADLKAEVERLEPELEQRCRELNLSLGQQAVQLRQIGELKAEVERFKFTLEEERQITRQDWAGLRCEHDRVRRALEQAEAEVERLRKAGDYLADHLAHEFGTCPSIEIWNAAKEGKQS